MEGKLAVLTGTFRTGRSERERGRLLRGERRTAQRDTAPRGKDTKRLRAKRRRREGGCGDDLPSPASPRFSLYSNYRSVLYFHEGKKTNFEGGFSLEKRKEIRGRVAPADSSGVVPQQQGCSDPAKKLGGGPKEELNLSRGPGGEGGGSTEGPRRSASTK